MAGSYEDMMPLPLRSHGDADVTDGAPTAALLSGLGASSSAAPHGAGKPRGVLEMELYGGGGGGGGRGRFDDDDYDEDMLLDWELHNTRRVYLFGVDCTPAVRMLPERFQAPPEWWFRLSRLQRQVVAYGACFGLLALLVGVLVVLPAAASGGARGSDSSSAAAAAAGAGSGRAPLLVDAATSPYCSWSGLYLPDVVFPDHYDLEVAADPRSAPYTVQGTVRIALAPVRAATPCVVLHSKGLAISEPRLVVGEEAAGDVIAGTVVNATEFDQIVIKFPEAVPLAPANVSLHIKFSYELEEGLDGFYRSSYKDGAGQDRIVASTHFEALGARKAFPCFDEPSFKATFSLRITAPPAPWVTLSNMPPDPAASGRRRAARRARALLGASDLVTTQYARSPRMPTYLVAWVIGELQSTQSDCQAGQSGKLPVAVWATPDRAGLLDTARDAACASVRALEGLLGVPHALPKLDLVGIPNFAAGAMENWGLIMYREARLVVDTTEGDVQQDFDVSLVVGHEVAHSWFGNLVTMRDWNELWLNEGFASYFENAAADAFRPEYRYFDYFAPTTAAAGMEADSDVAAHPLSRPERLTSLDDADNQFDDISYDKGASVLRMLRTFLNVGGTFRGRPLADDTGAQRMLLSEPKDPFLEGLKGYLGARAFNTSTYTDLWAALGEATGQPIADWMNTWTLRRGYPILSVDPAPGSNASAPPPGANVAITQMPFHAPLAFEVGLPYSQDMYCNDWSADPKDSSWWMPVAFLTSDSPAARWHAFNNCDSSLPVPLPAAGGWLVANTGRTGFYRVNYSQPLWDGLIDAAKDPAKISKIDLAGALDDAFAMALVRQLHPSIFLRLARAVGQRAALEYAPWDAALHVLRRLKEILSTAALDDPKWAACADSLRAFATASVTGPVITSAAVPNQAAPGLGLAVGQGEPVELRLLRPAVLVGAGSLGNKQVVAAAAELLASGAAPHPDVRAAVYRLAVMSGDESAFDNVLKLYKEERSAPKRAQLLRGLRYATGGPLIRRALGLSLDPDVRTQDIGGLIAGVGARGGVAFNMTWQFVFENVEQLLGRFKGNAMYSFGRQLSDLAPLFTSDASLEAVKAFAAARPGVLPPTFVESANDALHRNQQWLVAQGADACAWLDAAAAAAGGGSGSGSDSSSSGSDSSSGDASGG